MMRGEIWMIDLNPSAGMKCKRLAPLLSSVMIW